jgi:Tol biopolymer transport system component
MFCTSSLGTAAVRGLLCLVGVLALCTPARAEWDVTDTGQPYKDVTFTVMEGTWMTVDVSPDGKTLVFDLLNNIYSMPAEGGEAKVIHGGPALARSPRFSPDGSKLLYFSDRVGADNLWISNTDGSDARQITHEISNILTTVAWGPGGQYVVASKFANENRRYKASEIWLYHLDGGTGRLLIETPKNDMAVVEPAFSHDGRYLYYTENISTNQPSFVYVNALQPIYAIKRRRMTDGTVDQVLAGFGGATTGEISPDDTRIAFVRRVKAKTVLFVYNLRTGEQRPVYDGLDRGLHASYVPRQGSYYPQFAWFPDGRHVAIWSGGKIYKIDVDTQAREELPFRVSVHQRMTAPARFESQLEPAHFTVHAIQQPVQAPNGESIVFSALGHLWQKSLPAGTPQRLTQASAFEYEPNYSADGSSLAYVSWDDEKGGGLELMKLKGRKVTSLLKGLGIIRQPAFSADGKSVCYWLEGGNDNNGGYRAVKPGIYWLLIAEGRPHYVASVHGNSDAHAQFSPDGRRIYYVTRADGETTVIESVNLDGLDARQHVSSGQLSELRLSPDLNWLAYKKELQYYVIPYREIGTPLKLTKTSQELPVSRLTPDYAGFELSWTADSRRVTWMLGPTFFSATVGGPSPSGMPLVSQTPIGLEVPADRPQGIVAFTNGRIITMHGDQVIDRGTLVVEGNRIVAVGEFDRIKVPNTAKVIDVSGKTLMPGLIDMHGHMWSKNLLAQKQPNHYAALAFGVTTDFDPSNSELPGFATAEMTLAGVTVGPRYISTGVPIFGIGESSDGGYHPLASLNDARRILAYKQANGAIILKSYTQPMRSQRQQLIKAAREAGVMVTPEGESNFYHNVTMLLDGHVSVEHNFPLANYYDDVVQLVAHGSTSLTPTLMVTMGETWAENYFYETTRLWDDPKVRMYIQRTISDSDPLGSAPDAPPYVRGMATLHQADELSDIGVRSVARSLKKIDDAGGVINVGAHGILQGLGTHWEMWALAEGGMSNLHVLRAGTLNGAKTLGLDKQIGSLEVGKFADLIVLDVNPLENIRNTNTVRYTMINGRLYDSMTMNEIGNYNRPRSKFFWEMSDYKGIDWNEAWGGPGLHSEQR